MKHCTNCGVGLDDAAKFCTNCGTPCEAIPAPVLETVVYDNDADIQKEREFLENTKKLAHWEGNLWRIGGIILTVCGAIIFLLAIILAAVVAVEESFVGGFVGGLYGTYGILFLALGIVNLVFAGKPDAATANIFTDVRPTLKHYSVGRIVLSAILGGLYPIIFVVINFVRIKTHKDIIAKIATRQGVVLDA